MPLVDTSQEAPEGPRATLPQPAPTDNGPAPSALDVMAAAERQDNVAGMLYDRYVANPEPSAPAQPGFDPLASVPKGYEQYASRFLDADNPQQAQWIKGRIDQELADGQTIARAGGWGVAATLAAGATDPLTIASMAIPVGGEASLALRAGRMAAVAAGTTAAQEGIAQAVQETRTPAQSLTNIGTSAILGGIIGSVIRPHVPAQEFGEAAAQMDAQVAPSAAAAVNPTAESTAGAAAVAKPTLEDNTLAGPGKILGEGIVGQVAPGLRLLTSPSATARDLVQQLAETRETLNKNLEGIATPIAVETRLRSLEGVNWQAMQARGEAFSDYRARVAAEPPRSTLVGEPAPEPLSRSEFMQQVAYAMRRGDQSPVPEVAQAAADTRRIAFDPLKQRAQAAGLLPQDVQAEGADSYLMRQYDAPRIRANMVDWMNRLQEGFKAQGVDPAEATDIAHSVTRNVLGSERGTMDWHVMDDVPPQAGPLQERTLKLPDTLLEPYLNNDIDHLTHSYLRSMGPEVEMTERFGSRDMKDQLDQVRDEYAQMMERAKASGNNTAVSDLDARRNADIRDLSALRDRLYGSFGAPKDPGAWFIRAGRLLRSGNALRLLGAATLSHFPDIANVITRYGLTNTFKALGKLGTSWRAIQLTREQARRMGAGLDMVMNSTAARLWDYSSHSQFAEQRIASKLTRAFSIGTLETPLITMVQQLSSAMGQDELLRAAQRAGTLSKAQITRLASAGIDQSMLKRIAAQAAQHGQEVNGLRFGMSDQWADQEAAQAFESSILKTAHAMTLSPGAGDTPLVMSTELGKLLMQFQSFAFAATRHVLMPLAQGVPRGDVRAMTGLFALLAGGYASYWAKQRDAGQPVENDNPGRLALEVLDRSNLLGWTGQAIFPALWQLGFKDLSRWSDRDATETLLGPTVGTLGDIYERRLPAKLTANTADGDQPFTRSDLHFIRRLMPGQNLWYFRRSVNGLEDSVGDLFNLPGVSQKERGEMVAGSQ